MSNMLFPEDSCFSSAPREAVRYIIAAEPLRIDTRDDKIGVDRRDLENWYQEANDMVRTMGMSTSTGNSMPHKDYQKRSQRGSTGALDIRELHERLTEHRDALYRYLH